MFIDRPVAVFFNAHRVWRPLFQLCAAPSLLPLPFACLYLGFAACRGRIGGQRLYLTISLAVLAATAAKDELKWIFGRPWPETWLKYGVYNFRPFANDWLHGGFPSGHTAYITAPLCVLWVHAPRLRTLWAMLGGLVMLGLVGAGYHFVGDVVAGLCTGVAAAAATMALLPGG